MAAFTKRSLEASADNKDFRYTVATLRDNLLAGADRSAVFVLVGAAGLLLLAILNLSALLLAWGFERRQEFAVRVALGAGSAQVTRLVLQQSFIIVAAGAVVGLGVSVVALRLLQSLDLGATVSPFVNAATLDLPVLAGTTLIAALAGIVAGALPTWLTRDAAVADTLRSASRSATLSRGALRWQQVMVFGQASLSAVILVAAVLTGVSFRRLSAVPDGFAVGSKVAARIVLPDATYGAHPARAAFARALADNLAQERELATSGFTTTLPVSDGGNGSRFSIELPDGSTPREPDLLHFRRISPGYFGAMGIPVLRGRAFTAQDDTGAVAAAIVSQALAERLWPEGGSDRQAPRSGGVWREQATAAHHRGHRR